MAIDNIRVPLRGGLPIRHFIQLSEAIVQVMTRSESASQYGHVSVPTDEIQTPLQAGNFLGQSLVARLRNHMPCLRGSGGGGGGNKYKRCRDAQLAAFFRS
ncbi:hypothetical protein [Stenotrophomonas maltophilia]|uniref:hypothetical protein n=1 Tax=Stenotrophomonas maltophilia TaxID=40324 RepID=UPI004042BA44